MDNKNLPVEPHILTLQELYDAALRMLRIKKMKKDTPIMITTADRSIGGRAFVYATWIREGFDWESGQIRIDTDEKVLKYKNGRDAAKSPVIRKYEQAGKKFVVRKCPACENKIGKEDRYCKYCGQKINVMSEENIIRGNVIEEEENSREIQ